MSRDSPRMLPEIHVLLFIIALKIMNVHFPVFIFLCCNLKNYFHFFKLAIRNMLWNINVPILKPLLALLLIVKVRTYIIKRASLFLLNPRHYESIL